MNTFSKILIIAKYTFKEIIKSRILYGTGILGVLLVLVTYVATEFTYGVPAKVALDFGLGILSLSSLGIALFMGAGLLSKEIETRTVYMIISRPVPRWSFILGKLIGLFGVLIVNVLILSLVTLVCLKFLGGTIDQLVISCIIFNILESVLLLLVVVLFSLFSNNILATLISLTLLMAGHAIQEAKITTFVELRPLLGKILEIYHLILPGFYKLNLKEFVVYQHSLDSTYLLNAFAYGTCYSAFLLFLILFIFQNKNLD
jgi:ABC-2 type transport system permease protein